MPIKPASPEWTPSPKFNHSSLGEKLSELVEKISDPMVVALDGSWGSGKSHFLKCWVGEHLKREGNTTQTVYFDAFEHDYLDDPLIALTGVIADRFRDDTRASEILKRGKKFLSKIAMPTLRIGGAVATSGATEMAGAVASVAFNSGWREAEKAAEDFWKQEDGKRAAMTQFKETLQDLANPKDGPIQKIVIVIDELDRCRPDYALTMLEVMKHFFAVDNVHFVLGVNMDELQNSVKARYGNEIDAAKYLQKFVTVTMPIVGPKVQPGQRSDYLKYFDDVSDELGLNSRRHSWLRDYLAMINHHTKVGLRDIERLVALAIITPARRENTRAEYHVFTGLLVVQIIKPELVNKARQNALQYSDVDSLFKLEGRHQEPARFSEARVVWKAVANQNFNRLESRDDEIKVKDLLETTNRATIVSDIIANCLDAFVLPQ